MKRIFAFCFAILSVSSTHGQTLLQLRAGAYDSDAQAYFNTLVANSCTTPSVAFKAAVSAYVVAEKAAGNWGNQDAEYILATADSCTASINLARPGLYTVTWNGSPVFTVQGGLPCDGATQYGDTNVVENALIRRTQSNGHIEAWRIGTATVSVILLGVNSTSQTRISALLNKVTAVNSGTALTDTGGGGVGLHAADRTSSSLVSTYKNGAVQTVDGSSGSTTLAASDVTIGKANTTFCNTNTNIIWMGEGAVMNNETTHYTNVHNLLIALGVTGI